MHMICMDLRWHIILSSVPEFLDKWNHLFFGRRFNKILVGESWINLEDLKKNFSINSELLLIQLEPVCICIFDLLDCVPELMHIYLGNFSSDQKSWISWENLRASNVT
ncbi:hypothetical protein Tco_1375067 [Tanacetum coccineum]